MVCVEYSGGLRISHLRLVGHGAEAVCSNDCRIVLGLWENPDILLFMCERVSFLSGAEILAIIF